MGQGRIVIGLTGGIGAGKSTFAGFLAELGAVVIDGDRIGREVIAEGGLGADKVLARFGTLDRRELAEIVFATPKDRMDLEKISWPLINAELRRRVAETAEDAVSVLDLAVLAQGDLGRGIYGPVVTIEADDDLRMKRLIDRGMHESDARARMDSQVPTQARIDIADAVVFNRGSLDDLRAEAERVWAQLVG